MTTASIYLVRHAQPVLPDDRRRFLGQSDPPLTTAGEDQARRLADRMRSMPFAAAYSSDLCRSMQTAEIITRGAAVLPDRRLREIDAGRWEGLAFDEARRLCPAEYAERERDLIGYPFPDGESFRELQHRAVEAFWEIVGKGGRNILVVAHRGTNRVLLCELLGLPLEALFSIEQDYCSVSLIETTVRPDGARDTSVTAPW